QYSVPNKPRDGALRYAMPRVLGRCSSYDRARVPVSNRANGSADGSTCVVLARRMVGVSTVVALRTLVAVRTDWLSTVGAVAICAGGAAGCVAGWVACRAARRS